jgi:hypothetical protein
MPQIRKAIPAYKTPAVVSRCAFESGVSSGLM